MPGSERSTVPHWLRLRPSLFPSLVPRRRRAQEAKCRFQQQPLPFLGLDSSFPFPLQIDFPCLVNVLDVAVGACPFGLRLLSFHHRAPGL